MIRVMVKIFIHTNLLSNFKRFVAILVHFEYHPYTIIHILLPRIQLYHRGNLLQYHGSISIQTSCIVNTINLLTLSLSLS